MSEDILQIDYDQMATIVDQFQSQADAVEQMSQMLNTHYADLKNEGWVGAAADAFFDEYETELEPALKRLYSALEDGGTLTRQVAQVLGAAEEEAANQFTFGEGVNGLPAKFKDLPFGNSPFETHIPFDTSPPIPPTPTPSPDGKPISIPSHPDGEYGIPPIEVIPSHPDGEYGIPHPEVIPSHSDGEYTPGENSNKADPIGIIPKPEQPNSTIPTDPAALQDTIPPVAPLFEDDWVGEVILIELVRPPITDHYVEISGGVSAEGSLGVVSGEVRVEQVERHDDLDGPSSSENKVVTEVSVGADVPILGIGGSPDLSIGVGPYLEVPIGPNPDPSSIDSGVQAKVELGPITGAAKASNSGIGSFEIGIIVPPGTVQIGDSANGVTTYMGAGAATNVTFVYERSYDNVLQVAVPVEIFNQYDGNLEVIHKEYLAPSFNKNESKYEPTGRFTHVDTVQYDEANHTLEIRPINDVLEEHHSRRTAGAGYGNPQMFMPENAGQGKIVIPRDDGQPIFDYSGNSNPQIDLANGHCYPFASGKYKLPKTIVQHGIETIIPGEILNE